MQNLDEVKSLKTSSFLALKAYYVLSIENPGLDNFLILRAAIAAEMHKAACLELQLHLVMQQLERNETDDAE